MGANVQNISWLTRTANTAFTGLGFIDRTKASQELSSLARASDPDLIQQALDHHSILKISRDIDVCNLRPDDISNVVTEERRMAFYDTIGLPSPPSQQVETLTSRLRETVASKVLTAKEVAYRGAKKVDLGLDRIYDRMMRGAEAAEDPDITAGLSASFVRNSSPGSVRTSLMLSFIVGTGAALALAGFAGLSLPVGFGLGMAGSFIYLHCPGLRDTIHKTLGSSLPVLVGVAATQIADMCHWGSIIEMGLGYGGMLASFAIYGGYQKISEGRRIETMTRRFAPQIEARNILFTVNESLYEVREATSSNLEARRVRAVQAIDAALQEVADSSHAHAEVESLLRATRSQLDPADLQIEDAIEATEALLWEQVQVIPDMHRADRTLTTYTKMARTLSLLYLIPLTACFLTAGQGPVQALLFGGIFLAQLFYTFGCFMYNDIVDHVEGVENLHYPKLSEDKKKRPVLSMIRYVYLGIRGDNILDSIVQDIYARVRYGKAHVVIDDSESNSAFAQTKGIHCAANEIDTRIHLIRRVIDGVFGATSSHSESEQRDVMAWGLSIKERICPAHRTIDVCNEVYQNSPTDGRIVRFRDSIGGWHGERVAYETLTCLFSDCLPDQVADDDLRSRYDTVLERLSNSTFVLKDFNLDTIHDGDAFTTSVRRMAGLAGVALSEPEIIQLYGILERNRERYLTRELRAFAQQAGIDPPRAYLISRQAADRLLSERRIDRIAELGDRCLLLGERSAELEGLLVAEHGLSQQRAHELVDTLAVSNIDQRKERLLRYYDLPDEEYCRWRTLAETARALDPDGQGKIYSGEEGNLRKAFVYCVNPANAANLTPGQIAFRDQMLSCVTPGITPEEAMDEVDSMLGSSSMSWAIAMGIEWQGKSHGMRAIRGLGTAKALGEEITAAIAPLQLFGEDWLNPPASIFGAPLAAALTRRITSTDPLTGIVTRLGREAAELLIWEAWMELVEARVRGVVGARIGADRLAEIDTVWNLVETELNRHKMETDLTTRGYLEIIGHQMDGATTLLDRFAAPFDTLPGTPPSPERIMWDRAVDLKGRRQAIRAQLGAIYGNDSDSLFEEVDNLIIMGSGYPHQYWAGRKMVDGEIVRTRTGKIPGSGWVMDNETLTQQIPLVLTGQSDFTHQAGDGVTYTLRPRVDDFDPGTALQQAQVLLEELVLIECGLRNVNLDLREWSAQHVTSPLPGQREHLVERGMQKSIADTLIELAAPGVVDAAQFRIDLMARRVPLLTRFVFEEMDEYDCGIRQPQGCLEPLLELMEGRAAAHNQQPLLRHNGLELTHSFIRLTTLSDDTPTKAGHTNSNFLGTRVGEQLGVLARYTIDRRVEEAEGYTRIPIQVHNLLWGDVVSQIRLSENEDDDYNLKLERGVTPDDMARQMVYLIWEQGLSARAAADSVWGTFWSANAEERAQEESLTRAHTDCSSAVEDIRANLRDVADEMAVLVCAHEAIGITAAYDQIEIARLDPTHSIPNAAHPYMERLLEFAGTSGTPAPLVTLLDGSNPLPSYDTVMSRLIAADGSRLDGEENGDKRAIVLKMAADAKRKLTADRDCLELSDRNYRYPWYTIPALWTPRDHSNVRRQFFGLEEMRMEMIIPRSRTMEEIVAWSCSQQGVLEDVVEEGRRIGFADVMRHMGEVGDQVLGIPALRVGPPPRIAARTHAEKLRFRAERDRAIHLLGGRLQDLEEAGEETPCGQRVKNYLDTARFEQTFFERFGADFHGNWDTDNIPSWRFPHFVSSFGYHNGLIVHRGQAMIQFGNNYEYQGLGRLIQSQQEKDTTLRDNMWLGRGTHAPRGLVRKRSKRLKRVAFPIGYANIFSMQASMECVRTVEVANWANKALGTRDEVVWGWEKSRGWENAGDWNGAKPGALRKVLSKMSLLLAPAYLTFAATLGDGVEFAPLLLSLAGTLALRWQGKQTKGELYHTLKRGSSFVPILAATFALGSIAFSAVGLLDGVPGGALPLLGAAAGGIALSRVAKTPAVPTAFAVYLAAATTLGAILPSSWFAGSDFWQIPCWVSAANLVLFNVIPRIGHALMGKPLRLNDHYAGRILYNITSIVEDSATAETILKKYFTVAGARGAVQWNDAVLSLSTLYGQYDRWFGGNAEHLTEVLPSLYEHRQMITSKQWLDLISCYLYPVGTFALELNRLGLIALTALWMVPITMFNQDLDSGMHLRYVIELGLVSFTFSLLAFRRSRLHEGVQGSALSMPKEHLKYPLREPFAEGIWTMMGSVSHHMLLESVTHPPIKLGVMKKFVSDIRSGFKTTQNSWNAMKSGLFRGDISMLARQSFLWAGAMGYFLYKVIGNNVLTDGVGSSDFSSLPMIFVVFWLLYDAQKVVLGNLLLNQGVSRESDWTQWNSDYSDQVRRIALTGGGTIDLNTK